MDFRKTAVIFNENNTEIDLLPIAIRELLGVMPADALDMAGIKDFFLEAAKSS
jgi:hypothetical protein